MLALEKFGPIGVGLLIGGLMTFWWPQLSLPKNLTELLSSTIDLSAVGVGFLGTIWAILVSIEDRPAMRFLKEVGRGPVLSAHLVGAIRWMFALAVLSLAGLVIDLGDRQYWHRYLVGAWSCSITTATLSLVRITQIFMAVLRFDRKGTV